MSVLVPIAGIIFLLATAVLASSDRRSIRFRTVAIAFLLQASVAAFALYIPAGTEVLDSLVSGIQHVIDYGKKGIEFTFGPLGTPDSLGFIFAFHVLPVIVFFSALMAVLYYLGIMQRIVGLLGGVLQRLLKTSRAESLSAAANIFLGQTDAPLLIKPFIPRMTSSELFAVMTGGLASIAGSLMAGYAAMGIDLRFLITAAFMAAPGGLLMAKLMLPQTETPDDSVDVNFDEGDQPENVVDAAAYGATAGLKLAVSIGAMLTAFVALIALINGMVGGVADLAGFEDVTLQSILGTVLAPLAYLLGIPWSESAAAGSLIGQKIIINEFVAFVSLAEIGDSLSSHTVAVISIALCGFANIPSIAVLIGGLGSLAPSRRPEIARLGFRAVFAAVLANLMSAALASLFLLAR